MGSESVVFYHEHVLTKEKGTSKATPWHHDQPYYPCDGDLNCTIWIPVDPVPIGEFEISEFRGRGGGTAKLLNSEGT
jgi:hypothetical protein